MQAIETIFSVRKLNGEKLFLGQTLAVCYCLMTVTQVLRIVLDIGQRLSEVIGSSGLVILVNRLLVKFALTDIITKVLKYLHNSTTHSALLNVQMTKDH
ncbi:hypothetical protein NQ317_003689 [Molorchus minor]|uniref:Uncharacterized protein n=1 Tax=Molorchus minor TaxID=1323400 RepID=A0ABQ9K3Y1_9CUCU|nr:hypothetical protein NQ317_003689 [Molorchus minor]